MELNSLQSRFSEQFRRDAELAVRAPGRVNLIGEHTDYNGGFVLPIAIGRQSLACLAGRDDSVITFTSLQADESASIDLNAPIRPGEPAWANYCKGVAAGLAARGVELRGADILFGSDIPIGAGLSSSASLEVCTALALLASAGRTGTLPDGEIALLCQQAENQYAGAPCGIMDQSICVMAQAGHAMLLDCRSGQAEQVSFAGEDWVLLVADTQVRHDIAAGQYANRRNECADATDKLGLSSLRDADIDIIESAGELSAIEAHRARHIVSENARTLAAVDALKANEYERFGELMYESHASLRDDFEVSCDELDCIVELAKGCNGVYGARMTGGGFGGCAIILAESMQAESITAAVLAGFAERFGRACSIFPTIAAAGGGPIE